MEVDYELKDFSILKSNNLYYICYFVNIKYTRFYEGKIYANVYSTNYTDNGNVAIIFSINESQFIDLAHKHNALKWKSNKALFVKKEEAIKFAKYLQSLLVLNKLK